MRIGVLTLPLHGNIGGVLQNYALVQILKHYGQEVYTIDYRPHKHEVFKAYFLRFIRKIGLCKFIYHTSNKKLELLFNIRKFIDNNIPCKGPYFNFKQLKKISSQYDIIIVGSDQVWRKIFIYDSIDVYYLGFVNKDKTYCFSYAASIGTDKCEYTKKEIAHINKLLTRFQSISVREYSAISLIKDTFKWECPNPQLVLDPTFLLSASQYIELINKSNVVVKTKYLYYYLLDNNTQKDSILKEFKDLSNYDLYSSYNDSNSSIASIEQWLADIYYSNFVVTDSFHGVVFSIIFKKQFAVIINKERGSARFDSLLKLFELEDRIIDNNIEFLFSHKINYDKIGDIIETQKNISIKYIEKNIKGKIK